MTYWNRFPSIKGKGCLCLPSVQVVRGLGETLVGAYPGRALSFICKKKDLNSPQVSIGVY